MPAPLTLWTISVSQILTSPDSAIIITPLQLILLTQYFLYIMFLKNKCYCTQLLAAATSPCLPPFPALAISPRLPISPSPVLPSLQAHQIYLTPYHLICEISWNAEYHISGKKMHQCSAGAYFCKIFDTLYY